MVYKEEAFKKFDALMNEIELRIIKSVFSISANTQVQVERIDDSKLEVQSTEVENMKIGWNQAAQTNPQKAPPTLPPSNPLFNKPQGQKGFRQVSQKKNKIRV